MRSLAILVALLGLVALSLPQEGDSLDTYQKQLKENPKNSLAHYRIGEIHFQNRHYQSAANAFRAALNGDLEPRWTQVWSYINLGMIFDLTRNRERAQVAYRAAVKTQDNTRDAQSEAARYLETPYSSPD